MCPIVPVIPVINHHPLNNDALMSNQLQKVSLSLHSPLDVDHHIEMNDVNNDIVMNNVKDDIAVADVIMVDMPPITNEDADTRSVDADNQMSVM